MQNLYFSQLKSVEFVIVPSQKLLIEDKIKYSEEVKF